MEIEVVEVDNRVYNVDHNNESWIPTDMVLPGGFEGLENGNFENTDLGEDWVSLFFNGESYLNSLTTDGKIEPPVFQDTVDASATSPATDSDGSQPLSESTMILSSSPPLASSVCPPSSRNFDMYTDNIDTSDRSSPPSSSTAGTASTPGIQEVCPPSRPSSSPHSALTHASGASSSAVEPDFWGNEDLEEDGSHHPENGSEEESSTSNFDTSIPGAAGGMPVSNNAVPIQAQEVKSGTKPAASVSKIATAVRSSVDRSDRKRRSWERGETDNSHQQSCAQSELDSRKGSDSADGAEKDEDDEKRQARLMRNRESAQLSRQRKKVYVDELEGRLRTMAATIAELNATISHLTAENVNLRRQLGFFYQPSRPGGGVPIMPYPGMISARPVYPGAPMPPVPIPRLKSQQTLTKTPKRTKSTKEPGEKKKTKKVASLATAGVMSLLCVTMLLGPFGDWGSSTLRSGTTHIHVSNAQIRVGGRALTSWDEETENLRNMTRRESWADRGAGNIDDVKVGEPGVRNGSSDKMKSRTDRRNGLRRNSRAGSERMWNALRRNSSAESERVWQSCAECFSRRDESRPSQNFGEKFVATNVSEQVSLVVPINNRLIKVDGNLIIRAVMSVDKSMQEFGDDEPSGEDGEKGRDLTKQDSSRSGRSPPTPADHQLIKAISTQAQEGGGIVVGLRHSKSVGALREGNDVQKAAHKSDALAPSVSSTPASSQLVWGSPAEPVLSTGMCTEVFSFNTSPADGAPNAASSASSSVVEDHINSVREENSSKKTSEEPSTNKKKRDPFAVPLPPIRRKDRNGTEPVVDNGFQEPQPQSEVPQASGIVVSVFTRRQDITGEEGWTGTGASKGLSQIFVVVLVDRVKYITYSCMFTAAGSQVHEVAS